MSRIIGLTGQTGAGKTIAADYFCSQGFSIIDCDTVAREVVAGGSECLARLADIFSAAILNADNTLNRKALGAIVFSDKTQLEMLNATIFPYITANIEAQIEQFEAEGYPFILLDAPTLFESGANSLCYRIVSVIGDSTLRLKRIMERDKISKEQGISRIRSQHDDDFFRINSDYLIENNGSRRAFLKKLEEVWWCIVTKEG